MNAYPFLIDVNGLNENVIVYQSKSRSLPWLVLFWQIFLTLSWRKIDETTRMFMIYVPRIHTYAI